MVSAVVVDDADVAAAVVFVLPAATMTAVAAKATKVTITTTTFKPATAFVTPFD